jgi:ubiquitin-protein ligase
VIQHPEFSRSTGKPTSFWDGAVGGWSAAPRDNAAGAEELLKWDVKICGPVGSPYHGGTFCFEFDFSSQQRGGYPFIVPACRLVTDIFHTTLNKDYHDGRIDRTSLEYGEYSSITHGIPGVISTIIDWLRNPPRSHSFHLDLEGSLLHNDPSAFKQRARDHTLRHASGAHSSAMSLAVAAVATCSSFCSQKLRGTRIMQDVARHMPLHTLGFGLVSLQLRHSQRALLLCSSGPLALLVCRLAAADDGRCETVQRWAVLSVMKRCFRQLAWRNWKMFCDSTEN